MDSRQWAHRKMINIVIQETQIRTTVRSLCTLLERPSEKAVCWRGHWTAPPTLAQLLWKSLRVSHEGHTLAKDPATPIPGITLEKWNHCYTKTSGKWMFTAALFTPDKPWTQPECLSDRRTDKEINELRSRQARGPQRKPARHRWPRGHAEQAELVTRVKLNNPNYVKF